MRDIGNEETEKLIADLEKKIRREYEQAEKELNEKFNEYVRKFKIKDEIKKQQLARGEITQEFYDYWRKGQFSVAFRWQEMRRTMADDLTTVSQKARSIVDGYRGEAYAINHDYITFLIEKDSGIDTSYTLYNTRSAERLLKGDEVLPRPGKRMKGKIERGEVVKWQEGRIQSVTLQSLLQGESTEQMAQRICRTLSVSNYADAVRYARTAMTGAQNGGRFDAISRCRDEGIDVVGQWSATLDGRTRHTHRQIDGEVVEPGGMFSNGCRFPGDPNGPPAEIWRCRCRLNERIKGFARDPSQLGFRNTDHFEYTTYEDWKNEKAKVKTKKSGEKTEWFGEQADKNRKIYGKIDGMNYSATKSDNVELWISKKEKDGIFTTQKKGEYRVPENKSGKAEIHSLPSEAKIVLGELEATKSQIMSSGRIALSEGAAKNDARLKAKSIVENECYFLGGVREEGYFYRAMGSDKEIKYIESGKIRPSVNHMTGEKEDGLSVWEYPKYGGNIAKVRGDVIGIGSDGEPLLEVKTIEYIGKADGYLEAFNEGKKRFCEIHNWTSEQLEDMLACKSKIVR